MKSWRWTLSALAVSLAVLCAARPAEAQAAPPVTRIGVTREAAHSLDSMALDANKQRAENGACLATYAIAGDTLFIGHIKPANYVKRDSVNLFSDTPLCPHGVPAIHSHIKINGQTHDYPSELDLISARRGEMWALLLVVSDSTWRVVVFP